MLKVQILTLNNRETIKRCLDSAFALGGEVVVGDMGSTDGTPEFCKGMGASVVFLNPKEDMSSLRNSLIGKGLNMYLEPWEFLAPGFEVAGLSGATAFYVVQGKTVSKQVRFWERGFFTNPVFEHLNAEGTVEVRPDLVVLSDSPPDRRKEYTEACRRWVETNPTSPNPYYYLACSLLAEGLIGEFSGVSRKYMVMSGGEGESALLMNYYIARTEVSKGMFKEASTRILSCIASRPTFAEFWCLLGDMFFYRGKYEKACEIYKNARLIGLRRKSDDMFPIEIPKYKSYPMYMERKCSELASGGYFVADKDSSNGIYN